MIDFIAVLDYDWNIMFNINNRRYTGSKAKLMPWIKEIICSNCECHNILFDVFGGTGIVSAYMNDYFDKIIINDFLFSNEIIYKAFFNEKIFNQTKLNNLVEKYRMLNAATIPENYVSENYGNKYFKYEDAKIIGYIRNDIELLYKNKNINEKEYDILLASLLYSFDRCANTVGHYEAYIKGKYIKGGFIFELISPLKTKTKFEIYREDSNLLAPEIKADVAFIDPPYNSRQYSRFYHVLETITKWDKPALTGTAMKPPEENMSDYCRNSAPNVFDDLIMKLDVKYIVVTYNNTYDSKSSSSRNKISLEQIKETLEKRGKTILYEKKYHRFNAGKTDVNDHKEIVFFTKVDTQNEQ